MGVTVMLKPRSNWQRVKASMWPVETTHNNVRIICHKLGPFCVSRSASHLLLPVAVSLFLSSQGQHYLRPPGHYYIVDLAEIRAQLLGAAEKCHGAWWGSFSRNGWPIDVACSSIGPFKRFQQLWAKLSLVKIYQFRYWRSQHEKTRLR